MELTKPITGIILSGGKSSRMGADKAMVPFRGQPFLYWVSAALRPLVDSILIVSAQKTHLAYGERLISDTQPNQGPLMGIYSGLAGSSTEWNLVLSCDIPTTTTNMLTPLIQNNDGNRSSVTYQNAQGTSPILGLFRKSACMPTLDNLLRQGERRYQKFLTAIDTTFLPLPMEWEELLKDINTPEQLKELRYDIDH